MVCPVITVSSKLNAHLLQRICLLKTRLKIKITFLKLDNKKHCVNQNHDWYFQVQGQLHISNKSHCIFAVWTGTHFPLKVERILRDDKFWEEKMLTKSTKFLHGLHSFRAYRS